MQREKRAGAEGQRERGLEKKAGGERTMPITSAGRALLSSRSVRFTVTVFSFASSSRRTIWFVAAMTIPLYLRGKRKRSGA